MRLRLGTRGSQLALAQSELVARRLRASGHEVDLVSILTEGDVRPPDTTPGEGMFVTALAAALKRGEIDVAVHSAKDVPLEEDGELVIAAYPERADARDVLVTKAGGRSIASLASGMAIGTDSPRRGGFIRAARRDVRVVPLHGNVDTRLRRLDAGEVDAIVIAAAGLDRLGHAKRIDERIDVHVMAPAPAQGALAVQARRSDPDVVRALAAIDRAEIRAAVESEREVLATTGGTCRAPVGAYATVEGDRFTMVVGGVNSDGSDLRLEVVEGPRSDALRLAGEAGRRLAGEVALR